LYFEIQVGQPRMLRAFNETREDLASAIRALFPATTEDAILVWNWIPVRINYNADLSVIIEDLLWMLDDLLKSDHGTGKTFFGASTLRAEWSLDWANGGIRVTSRWDSIAGSYESLLNQHCTLELSLKDFLSEWKALLRKVIEAIELSGITVTNHENLVLLRRIESFIPEFGVLYRAVHEVT